MEEKSESVLEAIYEGETLEDEHLQDVEMLDAETIDGDLSQQLLVDESTKDGDNGGIAMQESRSRKSRRRKSKKKRNKKTGAASNITDINRFVVDTCRHLKERKSYLVWNAVGVLGASTVSNLIKEYRFYKEEKQQHASLCLRCSQQGSTMVDAIQDGGGQLTADGKRFRSSGGILWNILKTREPKAYKEIMAKGKEFEMQFRQQNNNKPTRQGNSEATFQKAAHVSDMTASQVAESSHFAVEAHDESTKCDSYTDTCYLW